tara:strand:+ start:12552 stop:13442 length:891 start_codon:yes stop_codon:yes gene_type:complete
MAFNKIQPEQVQQPTFFSDSGGLNIEQTNTGIRLNVSQNLTGNFAFTGAFLTNGKSVFGLANTGNNFFLSENDNMLFLGSNTQIRGTGNVGLYADRSAISGTHNVAINVNSATFFPSGEQNTALHGYGITFPKSVTGSLAMKDWSASSQVVNRNHSFYCNFQSGHFFEGGQNLFNRSVSFGESGIVSGNLQVLGGAVLSGSTFVNDFYLTGYASGNYANLYEDQAIAGEKTINSTMRFATGFQLPAYTGTVQGAHIADTTATGSLAISGHTLYICVGHSAGGLVQWAGIPISGALS